MQETRPWDYEIDILTKLINSEWWKYMKKLIKEEMEDLKADLYQIDAQANKLDYTAHDLNRVQIDILSKIIEKPEELKRWFESARSQGTFI